jgi:hypothetical protein
MYYETCDQACDEACDEASDQACDRERDEVCDEVHLLKAVLTDTGITLLYRSFQQI